MAWIWLGHLGGILEGFRSASEAGRRVCLETRGVFLEYVKMLVLRTEPRVAVECSKVLYDFNVVQCQEYAWEVSILEVHYVLESEELI